VVRVRDEDWLVTQVSTTSDGMLVTVQGLSELVRDTTAQFSAGLDHIVPVDIYLPGCPPRPEMLLNAMLELTRQIEKKPLFKHREEIARTVEAATLSATPTHEMKGLLA